MNKKKKKEHKNTQIQDSSSVSSLEEGEKEDVLKTTETDDPNTLITNEFKLILQKDEHHHDGSGVSRLFFLLFSFLNSIGHLYTAHVAEQQQQQQQDNSLFSSQRLDMFRSKFESLQIRRVFSLSFFHMTNNISHRRRSRFFLLMLMCQALGYVSMIQNDSYEDIYLWNGEKFEIKKKDENE